MGDQRVQSAAEGQRSGDDQHGEYGAGDCRPYRHGGSAVPRFEGKADTGNRGHRRAGARSHTCQARNSRGVCPDLLAGPARCLAIGEPNGGGSDAADEREQPEAEHRNVNLDPGCWIDRAHRANGRERGQPDRYAGREQRPEDDGAKYPQEPLAHHHRWAGAQGTEHLDVFICGLKLPRDHLHRDQQRRGHGDDPEHRQGDGLRLHCPVDLPLDDRGDVKGVRCAGRKGPDNFPLYRRDPARAITEPESVQPVPRSRADQSRKRRGEQQERREAVDLVHHDLVVEHHGSGQPHVQATVRLDSRRAEGGLACLRVGVKAHRDHLADVPAEQPFRLRGRDELTGATRIGHPACRHGDPVLTEVLSVDAADTLNLASQVCGRENRSTRSSQRERVDRLRCGPDPLHAGQPFQGLGQVRREHGQAQVGRIGAGEERGKRGLGSPRCGDRAHRDPASQPDQQHNRQIAVPPAAESSRKAIPRDPHDLSAPRGRVSAALTSLADSPTLTKVVTTAVAVVPAPLRPHQRQSVTRWPIPSVPQTGTEGNGRAMPWPRPARRIIVEWPSGLPHAADPVRADGEDDTNLVAASVLRVGGAHIALGEGLDVFRAA